jgi:sulfite exporter TauE/SafE
MEKSKPISWGEIRQHLLFNFGRTVSYALIGAGMGFLGTIVYDVAAIAAITNDVRAFAGLAVGGFIVLTGFKYVLTGTTAGLVGHFGGTVFQRVSARMMDQVDTLVDGPKIALLGAVHGVLPCPLLYPAFLFAFVTGSPLYGATALGVLGLGTVPAVFTYGVAFQFLAGRYQSYLHRALGIVFLALGYLPIAHGLMLFGFDVPHPTIPIYQPLG